MKHQMLAVALSGTLVTSFALTPIAWAAPGRAVSGGHAFHGGNGFRGHAFVGNGFRGHAFVGHGFRGRAFVGRPFAFHHRHFFRPFVGFGFGGFGWPGYAYAPYDYSSYAYAPPPYYDSSADYTPAVSYTPAPAYAAPPPMGDVSVTPSPTPMQTVVEYPHGKYVLRGDGVTTPYQWVWIPNPPAPPPAPGTPAPSGKTPGPQGKIYRWMDDQGAVHLTDSLERVPKQFRSQATAQPS